MRSSSGWLPGLPDIDGLAPLPGRSVKHVYVGVAGTARSRWGISFFHPPVHHQEAIGGGGDPCRSSRVHDLHLPGLPPLQVHVDTKSVEDEQELSSGKLYGTQCIHGAARWRE